MSILDHATRLLAPARGRQKAVKLDELALRLGISRREAEMLMEQNLQSFPFVLVAGPTGYYQPATAEDLNTYLRSLHSRHRKMQIREATVRRKARLSGWREEPTGRFANPPRQLELIA